MKNTMEKSAILGEILIRYRNEKMRKGTESALERIEKIAVKISDDSDDEGWYVIVTVASVEDGQKIRQIVAVAPRDMVMIRDDVAYDYHPVTGRQIAEAGISVEGGLGDDLDQPGRWRVAETPDGHRLEESDDEQTWGAACDAMIEGGALVPSDWDKYLEATNYAEENGIDIYEAKMRLGHKSPRPAKR
jgi:hypothetical protein